jgi:hypothetical protein
MTELAYASARVAARFGARPQDSDWRRLEVQRALAALLEAARGTPLGRWTAGVTAGQDAHAIARVLRDHRRALAAEVTGWMPAPWRSALAWLAVTPDLPACAHLASGRPPRPWMHDDVVYREWLRPVDGVAAGGARGASWRGGGDPDGTLAALATRGAAASATPQVCARWRAEWRRRLPRQAPASLVVAGDRVAAHFHPPGAEASGAASGPRFDARRAEAMADSIEYPRTDRLALSGARTIGPARGALTARLTRLYRRGSSEPAAAFGYLGLALVDFERLEGELARRVLFADLPLAA